MTAAEAVGALVLALVVVALVAAFGVIWLARP